MPLTAFPQLCRENFSIHDWRQVEVEDKKEFKTEWKEILKEEDKKIYNSDQKYKKHMISLENMSEELVYSKNSIENKYLDEEGYLKLKFQDMIENKKLFKAFHSLPPRQKEIIELFFWKRMKVGEIADKIGCTQSTVSVQLKRAINKLRDRVLER